MGRHGTVSGLIRVITFIKALGFGISFQLSDNPVGVFGIIFGNKSLNTGRIKNGHISPGRINRLAYGFGKIHKMIKDILKVSKEILLETGDFGSIRNLVKTAEIP